MANSLLLLLEARRPTRNFFKVSKKADSRGKGSGQVLTLIVIYFSDLVSDLCGALRAKSKVATDSSWLISGSGQRLYRYHIMWGKYVY